MTLGCTLALMIVQDADAIPAPLRAMEESRRSPRPGVVDWNVLPSGDESKALSFVNRFARNGDFVFEIRGDVDGWTVFDGQSGRGASRFPQLYLRDAEGWWLYQETDIGATWWGDASARTPAQKGEVRDIRAIGTTATSSVIDVRNSAQFPYGNAADPIIEWHAEQQGDVHIVTGTSAQNAITTWYINSEKGWNPECVVYQSGSHVWESISKLDNHDGTWFPSRTDYFAKGALVESIVVRAVRHGGDHDKPRFTLGDLGMQPGEQIAPQHLQTAPGEPLVWNGDEVCSWMQWNEDKAAGRRDWGPRMKRLAKGQEKYDSPYLTDEQRGMIAAERVKMQRQFALQKHDGLWAQYVRDFIARYSLNNEQTQKALLILDECRKQADAHLARSRDKWEDALNALDHATTASQPAEGQADAARKRIEELRKPIDDIFAKQLCPRLEKLPTRDQRKNAESQPAANKPTPD